MASKSNIITEVSVQRELVLRSMVVKEEVTKSYDAEKRNFKDDLA
jgi:hypothetical protein